MIILRARRATGAIAGVATVLIAGGVAFGAWVSSAKGSPVSVSSELQADGSQLSAVKAAFSQAIQDVTAFGSPSAAYEQSVQAALHAKRQVPAASAALRSQLLESGKAEVGRYFAGKQTVAEDRVLTDAMALDANPDIVNLGSGVSKIDFRNVAVADPLATVEANVTVWAKSEIRQTATGPWLLADPVNIVTYTATLRLSSSGAWQVTSLTGSFVPGYGP